MVATERRERHLEARSFVVSNQLSLALDKFRSTIDDLGPHVGLQCDLAGCYYELGRFTEFEEVVTQIARDFERYEDVLCASSKRKTALMLAKFFEELAEPSQAISWLERASSWCEDLEQKKWIFGNELRILSYFGVKAGLQRKYRALLEMHGDGLNLKIEVQHALMWAEWALFGYNHAEKRRAMMRTREMNDIDRRLVARDFIEISLLSNVRTGPTMEQAVADLKSVAQLDVDRILLGMVSPDECSAFDRGDAKLSPMMTLRMLILNSRFEPNPELQFETVKKFGFLVGGLSSESRRLFKTVEPVSIQSRKIDIDVHVSEKKLSLVEFGFNSKLTSLQIKFLRIVTNRRAISMDELALLLWNEASSESTYHRVRMLVYKLNALLSAPTCVTPFEIKKDGVTIHSDVQFHVL